MSSIADGETTASSRRQNSRVAWARGRRSESQSRVVAFFGLFGVGNIGNEASLASAVLSVRRMDPAAELVCVCAGTDSVRLEHDITAVPIGIAGFLPEPCPGPRVVRLALRPLYELARWVSCYRFVRRVDLVVVPGTGILDDFGVRPWQMPYDLFRWSLAARLARTRFVFISVGAGPIIHPVSRWLMRQAVRFSSYCSYRDEGSRSFMASLGAAKIGEPVRPDIVFGLPRPGSEGDPAIARATSADTTIGLGVMSYFGWTSDRVNGLAVFRSYIDKLATIACHLLDDGNHVRILVGERSDAQAVEALCGEIRRRRAIDDALERVIVEPIESMHDLLVQIQHTDAVIATRYHNVVGALMVERPVVSIGYADKFVDVMTSMGLGLYCHDVNDFEPDAVLRDLDTLLRRWGDLCPRVEACNQQYIHELNEEFELVIQGHRPFGDGDPGPNARTGTRHNTA